MTHGTLHAYNNRGCRCEKCRAAKAASMREYKARKRGEPVALARGSYAQVDQDLLSDLLHELFPDGLTDDCPARRAKATA
jgi:hypothetical protein